MPNARLIRFLDRWVVPFFGRRRPTLTRQVDAVAAQVRAMATREELDILKSSLEITPALEREFSDWKQRSDVPAEPLISVCIATYNRARLLTERSIPSVLAQSYRNIEVIVVGDACTDDTADRVAALADDRVRFINLAERGEYPTDPELRWMVAGTVPINHALRLARGDFITHLDDDDEYLPHRLECLVDFARDTGCDFVWHPFWWEDEPGSWILNDAREFSLGQVTTSSVFYRSWFRQIEWDIHAYRLREPGDWNRFRKIKYLRPDARRLPEPLVRHYRERNDGSRSS